MRIATITHLAGVGNYCIEFPVQVGTRRFLIVCNSDGAEAGETDLRLREMRRALKITAPAVTHEEDEKCAARSGADVLWVPL